MDYPEEICVGVPAGTFDRLCEVAERQQLEPGDLLRRAVSQAIDEAADQGDGRNLEERHLANVRTVCPGTS